MSDERDFSLGELQEERSDRSERQEPSGNGDAHWTHKEPRIEGSGPSARVLGTGIPSSETSSTEPRRHRWVDPWRLVDAVTRRWFWLFFGTIAVAAPVLLLSLWLTNLSVKAYILKQPFNIFSLSSSGGEAFQGREIPQGTLLAMMSSAEVIKRVSAKANPPIDPKTLAKSVRLAPERNDFVSVQVSGSLDKQALVNWANLFAAEAVQYSKEIQADEAGMLNRYLKQQLETVNRELLAADERLKKFSSTADAVDFRREVEDIVSQRREVVAKLESARFDLKLAENDLGIYKEMERQSPGDERVEREREKLLALFQRGFADGHPEVKMQRNILEQLQKEAALAGTNAVRGFGRNNSFANSFELDKLKLESKIQMLRGETNRLGILQTEVKDKSRGLSGKASEYAALETERQRLEVKRTLYANRQGDAQLLQDNALGYYRFERPASIGDVNVRHRWFVIGLFTAAGAFAGLVGSLVLLLLVEVLDSRIKTTADVQRVTDLPILATLGDLRRMKPAQQINWAFRTLTLLQGKLNPSSDESLVCGFISSHHGEGRSTWINLLVSAANQRGLRVLTVATRPVTAPEEKTANGAKEPSLLPVGPITTLTKNVLAYPAQVLEQFNDPAAQPIVHIPLPGWVWNLERRKQWQRAVAQWRSIENMVLLIELPPACEPESVLLAENLPQVIWLTDRGMSKSEETREHLETLRHARCNLVGAVLNRDEPSFWKKRFSGWLGRAAVLLGFAIVNLQAAETNRLETSQAASTQRTNVAFSALAVPRRAPWQERLTLGPGDVIDIALYGHPELARTNLVIGPDGRFNYLRVQDFPAAGLTVDELRGKLDELLAKDYQAAPAMITPVSFNSKKYFMLGGVVTKGVFILDRPLTIIEAVARARGFETGMVERNIVEMVDFSRSFLVRQGKRLEVDFERLFHQGDLTQNISLEPNDYIYFPSARVNEVYVLGEIVSPGIAVFAPNSSLIPALAARGGFTARSYKKKVLIVRGSLEHPETFVVDTGAILTGKMPDFKLQPKDIVYISARPWIKVEELLDIAAQSFIQAAITGWVGSNIGPVIAPSLPGL